MDLKIAIEIASEIMESHYKVDYQNDGEALETLIDFARKALEANAIEEYYYECPSCKNQYTYENEINTSYFCPICKVKETDSPILQLLKRNTVCENCLPIVAKLQARIEELEINAYEKLINALERNCIDILEEGHVFFYLIDNKKYACSPSQVDSFFKAMRDYAKTFPEYNAYKELKQQLKEKDAQLEARLEIFDVNKIKYEKVIKEQQQEINRLKAEVQILRKAFNDGVVSENQFYFPKPICKRKPPECCNGYNGCLYCPVVKVCTLFNIKDELEAEVKRLEDGK